MAAHLTISLELITFMKWILEHKQESLGRFVESALSSPSIRKKILAANAQTEPLLNEDLYETVNNFLGFIEYCISEELHNSLQETIANEDCKKLYQSLSAQTQAQLERAFDQDSLANGMHHAAAKLQEAPDNHSYTPHTKKQMLLASLLSTWKPADSDVN